MRFPRKFVLAIAFLSCCSCTKSYLYVQQEVRDEHSLASAMIKTPDPRKDHPFYEQKILIGWSFPLSQFRKDLTLKLTVRFWNNEEQVFEYPVKRQRHYTSYTFANNNKERDKRILTYHIDVIAKNGEIIQKWEHQFWTELIELDKS